MKTVLFQILFFLTATIAFPQDTKPRTIVTTDGEVDDQDSFIRLLLYSNEFDIIGLVYSSSQWHYKGDGRGTKFTSKMPFTEKRYGERTELRWPGTTWMEKFIDRYALVYDNLATHAVGFPSPQYLRGIVKTGNIDFEGEMARDTEGSDLIREILLDNHAAPVFIQVWGGTNTVARALKSIEEKYSEHADWNAIKKKVSDKAVLYMVLDQDNTYKTYVEKGWPDIRVLYNSAQFWNFAYPWPRVVPNELQPYLRGPWFKEHIKFNHGPLLSNYYLWGDGTAIENDPEHNHGNIGEVKKNKMGQYDFISEGDSPAFFHLVDVGLDNLKDASWGGWGGRMVQSKKSPNRWEDGDHVTDFNPFTAKDDKAYPQTRWIDVLQNDFAARADWCVMPYAKANHPPVVTVESTAKANAGATIRLSARATDPDGNQTNFKWWQYHEVDSYPGKIVIQDPTTARQLITIPQDAKPGDSIHLIAEVSDNGTPALTRYKRIVLTIE
jgi:hypothetical protein